MPVEGGGDWVIRALDGGLVPEMRVFPRIRRYNLQAVFKHAFDESSIIKEDSGETEATENEYDDMRARTRQDSNTRNVLKVDVISVVAVSWIIGIVNV